MSEVHTKLPDGFFDDDEMVNFEQDHEDVIHYDKGEPSNVRSVVDKFEKMAAVQSQSHDPQPHDSPITRTEIDAVLRGLQASQRTETANKIKRLKHAVATRIEERDRLVVDRIEQLEQIEHERSRDPRRYSDRIHHLESSAVDVNSLREVVDEFQGRVDSLSQTIKHVVEGAASAHKVDESMGNIRSQFANLASANDVHTLNIRVDELHHAMGESLKAASESAYHMQADIASLRGAQFVTPDFLGEYLQHHQYWNFDNMKEFANVIKGDIENVYNECMQSFELHKQEIFPFLHDVHNQHQFESHPAFQSLVSKVAKLEDEAKFQRQVHERTEAERLAVTRRYEALLSRVTSLERRVSQDAEKAATNFSQVRRLVESYDQRLSSISHGLELVNGDHGSLKLFVDRLEAIERVKDEISRTQKNLHERMTTCEGSVQVSSSELRALIASQHETHAHRLHVEALERHTKFQEELRVSTSRSHDGVLEHHKKMHEDLHVAFTKKHADLLERVQHAEQRMEHLSHTPPPPPPPHSVDNGLHAEQVNKIVQAEVGESMLPLGEMKKMVDEMKKTLGVYANKVDALSVELKLEGVHAQIQQVDARCQMNAGQMGELSRAFNDYRLTVDGMHKETANILGIVQQNYESLKGRINTASRVQDPRFEDVSSKLQDMEERFATTMDGIQQSTGSQYASMGEKIEGLSAALDRLRSRRGTAEREDPRVPSAATGESHLHASQSSNTKASKSNYMHSPYANPTMQTVHTSSSPLPPPSPSPPSQSQYDVSLGQPPDSHSRRAMATSVRPVYSSPRVPTPAMEVHSRAIHWLFDADGYVKPYRALEPPLFELSQLKLSGISGGYAFHEVRVFNEEIKFIEPPPGEALQAKGIWGKTPDGWIDPQLIDSLRKQWSVPVWDESTPIYDWEILYRDWYMRTGFRYSLDWQTRMLIATQPAHRQSFVVEQVAREHLTIEEVFRLIKLYGRHECNPYVPDRSFRELAYGQALRGDVGPDEWYRFTVKFLNHGRISTGGVNMWDAHSVFLAAICVYTEKMDPSNPWVQIRDDLLYAQTSNGDMKFTDLETYVFVMTRLKARRDGRFVLKGLVQHYTSGAVIGAVGNERTTSRYGSRRERSHSRDRGRPERRGSHDYGGGKGAGRERSHSQDRRRDGSQDRRRDGSRDRRRDGSQDRRRDGSRDRRRDGSRDRRRDGSQERRPDGSGDRRGSDTQARGRTGSQDRRREGSQDRGRDREPRYRSRSPSHNYSRDSHYSPRRS